jgi:hypothetical protein
VKDIRVVTMLAALLMASGAIAQTSTTNQSGTDTDIALLRSNVQTERTEIIGKTMQLNDSDAKAFWPLYREYSTKQQALGDEWVSVIKDYDAEYDSLTESQADGLTDRMLKFDKSRIELRALYYPKFKKAIGAKQAAKFIQVDNRLTLLVDLQIVDVIPIIQ